VFRASHSRSELTVDLSRPDSIEELYASVGPVDAVVSAAGESVFRPLFDLSDADFALCLNSKLMGQVNLVRFGADLVADGGSFTLTTGILARHPMPGSAAISAANAGLEGFVRAAALELPRGLRINAVAPGWVRETLVARNMDPNLGIPADQVAETYLRSVEGNATGQIFETGPDAG
jgi:NAD(P)-dependent dehydrogenase (short-subunit alcohol dehydrogenase family)